MFVAKIPLDGGTISAGSSQYTLAPDLGGLLAAAPGAEVGLPCRTEEADLWFAEHPTNWAGRRRCATSARSAGSALPVP